METKKMLADIVTGRIFRFGHYGYKMALNAITNMINES